MKLKSDKRSAHCPDTDSSRHFIVTEIFVSISLKNTAAQKKTKTNRNTLITQVFAVRVQTGPITAALPDTPLWHKVCLYEKGWNRRIEKNVQNILNLLHHKKSIHEGNNYHTKSINMYKNA